MRPDFDFDLRAAGFSTIISEGTFSDDASIWSRCVSNTAKGLAVLILIINQHLVGINPRDWKHSRAKQASRASLAGSCDPVLHRCCIGWLMSNKGFMDGEIPVFITPLHKRGRN